MPAVPVTVSGRHLVLVRGFAVRLELAEDVSGWSVSTGRCGGRAGGYARHTGMPVTAGGSQACRERRERESRKGKRCSGGAEAAMLERGLSGRGGEVSGGEASAQEVAMHSCSLKRTGAAKLAAVAVSWRYLRAGQDGDAVQSGEKKQPEAATAQASGAREAKRRERHGGARTVTCAATRGRGGRGSERRAVAQRAQEPETDDGPASGRQHPRPGAHAGRGRITRRSRSSPRPGACNLRPSASISASTP